MKKITLFLLTVALGVSMASAQPAQAAKIAYVNSETILRELPEAQEVKKELETTIQAWQVEYQKMVKDFQDASDDYQKKQALLDPKAKDDKEKALTAQRQQILDYQTQKFDTREGEGVKLREQKFAPIQEKVLKAIEQVAKEDGFTYVFDKLETASNLLYADAKFDLTYKVIDRLKRGAPAATPKAK
ncbi:MAG TPA: OmpH family outer membrane protein [Bacteroidota bacterium]|nr:OmpH family outer membrane protein [Bacteroidota bacterium]